jgi:ABC-type phosphate/phosphonate transport system ATPase subunit
LVELLTTATADGAAVVVSSHQLDLADRATRCIGLRDGQVVHDGAAGADTVRRLVSG